MRRLLIAIVCSSVVSAGVLALAACSVSANVGDLGGSSPAAESGAGMEAGADVLGTTDGPGDAPLGDTSNSSDAPVIDAGCGVDFAQEATFIDVKSVVTGPPQYTGGTLVAGVYGLTGMTYFAGTKMGTVQVRETLRVRGVPPMGAFELLTEAQKPTGDFETIALHSESSTWNTPNGEFILETAECPTKGFQTTGSFTASGTTLSLFDGPNAIERVYTRLR